MIAIGPLLPVVVQPAAGIVRQLRFLDRVGGSRRDGPVPPNPAGFPRVLEGVQCHELLGQAVVVGGRGFRVVGCQRGFFELVPVTGSPQQTLYGHWQSQLHGALQVLHERNDEQCGDRTPAEMKTPDMVAIGPSPPT